MFVGNAYLTYVNRIRKVKLDKEEEIKRSKSKPGSGNVWKRGVTKIEEFHLLTEQNKEKHAPIGFSKIKSLKKPLNLNKFLLTSEYIPGHNRIDTKSYYELTNEINCLTEKSDKFIKEKDPYIKLENETTYEKALDYLHSALVTLDI